jgi:methylmalonyl-CoA/ethylmalonyl-CoA epimerase
VTNPVRQLRLVVHAGDLDEAVRFFRDVLGMPEEESYSGENGAVVTILGAGRATLELSNTAQIEMIDEVEVGRRVAPHFRVALEVDDATAATRRAEAGGAELVAEATETPWRSLNARLDAPGGVHLTLFQELDQPSSTAGRRTPSSGPLVQVAQRAEDLGRASAFYSDLLGVDPTATFDPPGLVFFDLGGVRLLLDRGAPSALHYLRVDDIDATVARLRDRGAHVETEPHVIFGHDDDTLGPAGTDEWMAFVKDSEGNLVGLVEQRPRG